LTDDEVFELIATLRRWGADIDDVEAKKATHALPKRLWETLSSFANQPGGGTIILGLDETAGFAAVGVGDVGKVQSDLASQCDDMEPPLRPLIRVHEFEGVQLVVVEVPEVAVDQKPCYYKGSGLYTGSFVRVADGDRKMSQYEVHLALENRGQPTHDIEIVPETSATDFDLDLVQRFLDRVRRRRAKLARVDDSELLQTLHLVGQSGEATLAGLLCFAPFPQRWFPNLTITLIHYPGTSPDQLGPRGERLLDNRRFDGPLPQALDDALQAVVGSMKQRTLIQGLFREEIPEYPPEAIREALVNAVAHRDYSHLARGTFVQIQIFQNLLVIQNPGGLFGPVNEENLGEPGAQSARNQFLVQVLEDLGPAENRGTGVPTMVRETRRAQMSPPEFDDDRTFFRVTFSNETMLDDVTVEWLNGFSDLDLTEAQRLAMAYTLHQQEITNGTFRRLTGADSRETTSLLHDLVTKGLLVQQGTRRWATYRLSPRASQAVEDHESDTIGEQIELPANRDTRLSPAQRQERICQLITSRGSISSRSISNELKIPRATVLYDLRKLVDANRLEITTNDSKDPRTEYRVTAPIEPNS
jgi:ATP-dependent DNA helicase RecG